jgi:hypothetical protein
MSDEKDLTQTDAIEHVDVEDVAPIAAPTYRTPMWSATGVTGPIGSKGSTGMTRLFTNPFVRSHFEDQEVIRNPAKDLEWTPPGMGINED